MQAICPYFYIDRKKKRKRQTEISFISVVRLRISFDLVQKYYISCLEMLEMIAISFIHQIETPPHVKKILEFSLLSALSPSNFS